MQASLSGSAGSAEKVHPVIVVVFCVEVPLLFS